MLCSIHSPVNVVCTLCSNGCPAYVVSLRNWSNITNPDAIFSRLREVNAYIISFLFTNLMNS